MIGSRLSVREEIAEDWDDADLDKITIYDEMKIVEQRLLKATEDFLEARKVQRATRWGGSSLGGSPTTPAREKTTTATT
jgi:hypothetical protein